MRQEVIVSFNPGQRYTLLLPAASADQAADQARRWLDDEFVANDCAPLRASGKVLIADKVLVLAGTVGAARFANDSAWAALPLPSPPWPRWAGHWCRWMWKPAPSVTDRVTGRGLQRRPVRPELRTGPTALPAARCANTHHRRPGRPGWRG